MDICRTLKGVDMDIRRTPGTQFANDRMGEVVYTPPEGEARLRDMLANRERFLHNQTELGPLIRMFISGSMQVHIAATAKGGFSGPFTCTADRTPRQRQSPITPA